jgi:nucleoside-diphosphate-sugar epimerase
MKRVLVTGASGFVGANLARRLVRDGHEVSILVRDKADLWRLSDLLDAIRILHCTLVDREGVERAVVEIGPEWVFHLAVHGAYSWQTDLKEMIDTNLTGTANLIDACLKVGFEAFVNTGSSSEYGFKSHACNEDDLLEPNSYYAITKASATHLCRLTARNKGVHIPTLRLYSVYGPYEEPKRLIPTLIVKGIGGVLPVLVDSTIARDYIHIDDVLEAYLLAAAKRTAEPGAIFNVGTGIQSSIEQIVAVTRTVFNLKAEPNWGSMPNRIWDSSNWVSDNRKLITELGWQPKHNLDSGFRNTVDWMLSNPTIHKFYDESLAASVR